jgi:outer membrane protein assembly factor BamE (lipoprotein component of BamABCDE complex)
MVKVFFLVLIIFSCNSCVKTTSTSGHLFEEDELSALHKAGTKQDVAAILGSPTSTSTFGQETWYYITTKKEKIAFLKDKIIEQNIVEITFNGNDTINKVYYYNEKDAKPLKLIEEYTASKGTESNTIQKFFYNVGRFRDNKQEQPQKPRSGF